MLRSLHIKDYALIAHLDIEFDSGLNIITGETGAGKSILLGALKMILGERAATEAIRHGANKAIIEGVFDYPENKHIISLLANHHIEQQNVLILRREISASHSRAFINDTPATLHLMKEVASSIIDLHGQHEHQSLLRTETHVELLDNFGGLGGMVEAYQQQYAQIAALIKEKTRLVRQEKELQKESALIEFQIREIDQINPQPAEEEDLAAELRILENAETLYASAQTVFELLYESDEAVYDKLVRARNELTDLARIDARFTDILRDVKSAEVIISETAEFVQDYTANLEFNPEKLEQLRTRSNDLKKMMLKYGATIQDVLDYRKEIGKRYEIATDFEGTISNLDKQILETSKNLSLAAQKLSMKRRAVAEKIEQAVVAELQHLGIEKAQFEVNFTFHADAKGWVRWQEGDEIVRFQALENGVDDVSFYISTNMGEKPKPLAKTASGGEISRVMLALKSILAKSERLPILVFDEIDTGISGRIAEKVGNSMHELAQYHQVVAITHLPQIAAKGDVHYYVEKAESEGRTTSNIRRLGAEERVRVVASLLAGEDITEAALQTAKDLMK